jgi:sialic acid synthase SpsE
MEIIAEIGQNHNGDMDLAKELILAAKECGADVAKFQLFDAPSLFPPTKPWFEYNCKTQLTREKLELLNDICEEANIEFMTSVFDVERVSWCEAINVKRYKVASRSIKDNDVIQAIADTGKPYIASLGMWDGNGFPSLPGNLVGYLYCISKYPTPLEDMHFASIDFDDYAGFSDHSIGITASCVALSRGAKTLEKHFTLDKNMHGPDHKGSMTPDELRAICDFRDDLRKCL